MRKKFFDMINKSQNFFKHADQDASAELDFDPEITEYLLYDAMWLYAPLVNGNITKEMRIFNFYFSIKNSHLIDPEKLKNIDTIINSISISNKKDFWRQISIIDSIVSKN